MKPSLTSVVFALFALPSWGQLNERPIQPFVSGGIAITGGLGYLNPQLSGQGGADIELPSSHLFLTAAAGGGWARKIETGDGHDFTADGEAFFKSSSSPSSLIFGGGVSWTEQVTSQWSKSATRPFPAFGYDGVNNRVIVSYLLPWLDSQNALQGPKVSWEARINKRLRLTTAYILSHYHDTRVAGVTYAEVAQGHWGGEIEGAVKVVF